MSEAARMKGKYHYNYNIVDSKAHKTKIVKVNDTQIKIIRFYENLEYADRGKELFLGEVKTMGIYNEMPMVLRDKASGTEKYMEYVTDVGTKTGIHSWYHKNGKMFKCVNYTDGIEDMSNVQICHDNGKIMETGDIEMGRRMGRWKYYNKKGKLIYYEDYREDGSGSTIELPEQREEEDG